jgi:hypothetical protein
MFLFKCRYGICVGQIFLSLTRVTENISNIYRELLQIGLLLKILTIDLMPVLCTICINTFLYMSSMFSFSKSGERPMKMEGGVYMNSQIP